MWLGTEQDIGKLYEKTRRLTSSLLGYNEADKDDIISDTVFRTIIYTRNHDRTMYGDLSLGRVFAYSKELFKQALIDYAKATNRYRESRNDDDKITQENEKWPAVEYIQPKAVKKKGEIIDSKEAFHLCSYKQKITDSPQKTHAHNIVKEVIDKQMLDLVDDEVSEFIKLCLWRCNEGYTLSELANQAGFIGSPVLERNTFIIGVDFVLEHFFNDLSLVLKRRKNIPSNHTAIDTFDSDSDETTHFTILPDTRPNTERSAYILEVYEKLKAAFEKVHSKEKEPKMANFLYLSFWRLNKGLSTKELAADCGVKADKAVTYQIRFIAKITKVLKKQNVDILIGRNDIEVDDRLRAVFDVEYKKIKDSNKAKFIHSSFRTLQHNQTLEELAVDCGLTVNSAMTFHSRFIETLVGSLKEIVIQLGLKDQQVDLFIEEYEMAEKVFSNAEFSRTELEQLFSHELENQVNYNE